MTNMKSTRNGFSKRCKPKLPRKRKKECIKAQGRKSYLDTVKLAKIEGEYPCKFWVNDSVKSIATQLTNGMVIPIPTPTRYW